jgi:hypothetical protein
MSASIERSPRTGKRRFGKPHHLRALVAISSIRSMATITHAINRFQYLGLYLEAGDDGAAAYWLCMQQIKRLGQDPYGVLQVDASTFAAYWHSIYHLRAQRAA